MGCVYQDRKLKAARFVGPVAWYAGCDPKPGSWWHNWSHWLGERSDIACAELAWEPLDDAPGRHVFS